MLLWKAEHNFQELYILNTRITNSNFLWLLSILERLSLISFFLLLFNLIRETREVKTSKKNKKSFVNKKNEKKNNEKPTKIDHYKKIQPA